MKKEKIKKLCVSAVFIALSTVLSMIQVVKMPLGGGITPVSMLPVILIGLMYGTAAGFASAFIYAVIQLILGIVVDGLLGWGLSPIYLVGSMLFDYILAYTSLGAVSLIRNKNKVTICIGIAVVLVFRLLCHIVSGVIFFASWCEWENVVWYSVCYNGTFMLPEAVLTVGAAAVVLNIPFFQKIIGQK